MSNKGQALITLLVFSIIAITIIGGAVTLIVINTQAGSIHSQSEITSDSAEAGIENAILKLLRDKDYIGETINLNDATVTITVSGDTNKTIISESEYNNLKRTIQVTGSYADNEFIIESWSEISQ